MIRFSDGVTFDTSGDYRVIGKRDGYYLVGRGMLLPVNTPEEGYEKIRKYKEQEEK